MITISNFSRWLAIVLIGATGLLCATAHAQTTYAVNTQAMAAQGTGSSAGLTPTTSVEAGNFVGIRTTIDNTGATAGTNGLVLTFTLPSAFNVPPNGVGVCAGCGVGEDRMSLVDENFNGVYTNFAAATHQNTKVRCFAGALGTTQTVTCKLNGSSAIAAHNSAVFTFYVQSRASGAGLTQSIGVATNGTGGDAANETATTGAVALTSPPTDACSALGGVRSGTNIISSGKFTNPGTTIPGSSFGADPVVPAGYGYQSYSSSLIQPNDGHYTVTNATTPAYGNGNTLGGDFLWAQISNHTVGDPSGAMLVINAGPPGLFFKQALTLTPNTTYVLSSYITNLASWPNRNVDPIAPVLTYQTFTGATATTIAQTGALQPSKIPNWVLTSAVFTTGATAPTGVQIANGSLGGGGDDLALDTIELYACDFPKLSVAKASNGPWTAAQTSPVPTYTFTVGNNASDINTTGVITLIDELPAGIAPNWTGTFVPTTTPANAWSCTFSGQTVTCVSSIASPNLVLGPVTGATAATSSFTIPISIADSVVPSTTSVVVTNLASVGGGADPNNGGVPPAPGSCVVGDAHCASNDTTVTPLVDADMIAMGSAPLTGNVGTPISVTTTCANHGPSSALAATCTVTGAPAGATTTCSPTSPIATLAPSGSLSCVTTFTPTSSGTVTLITTAASATADPDLTNNVATSLVTITGTVTVNPDATTTPYQTPVTTDVIANDSSVGSPLNPASVTPTTAPTHGTVTCAAGNCTYTPSPGFTGGDSYGYQVCDSGLPTPSCGTTVVTVQVGPLANPDTANTPINTPLTATVATNDIDPAGSTFTQTSTPAHGTATMTVTGGYTYTPSTDYLGQDVFTYTVCEAAPFQLLCSSTSVTITVVSSSSTTLEHVPSLSLWNLLLLGMLLLTQSIYVLRAPRR